MTETLETAIHNVRKLIKPVECIEDALEAIRTEGDNTDCTIIIAAAIIMVVDSLEAISDQLSYLISAIEEK